MSRPRPVGEVLIRLTRPLTPGATYRVRAIGLRGLTGVTGDSERGYAVPAPSPAAPPDSVPRSTAPATPLR
jgi:hypothetical protein